jgi:hypothetical protein
MHLFTQQNVPPEALDILEKQLKFSGAEIRFDKPDKSAGAVSTPSGELSFHYENRALSVKLIRDHGHFSRALLVGGVRQMIEEAIELAQKGKAA